MPLPFRLSRRSLLKTAARLGVGAGLALLGIRGNERGRAQEESKGPYFRDHGRKLTLGNQYYEVDFDSRNGAITRIFDKRGGGVVSEGNADGSLWGLSRGAWPRFWGTTWPETYLQPTQRLSGSFEWSWNETTRTLAFEYDMPSAGGRVRAHLAIAIGGAPHIDLTARVDNQSTAQVDWIEFPNRLSFRSDAVNRAMLPYAGGIFLGQSFFRGGETFARERYPS